jgi:hypothetical protein
LRAHALQHPRSRKNKAVATSLGKIHTEVFDADREVLDALPGFQGFHGEVLDAGGEVLGALGEMTGPFGEVFDADEGADSCGKVPNNNS